MEGDKAIIHKEGNRLTIEPLHRFSLLDILLGMEPITQQFPDIDSELKALDDIVL